MPVKLKKNLNFLCNFSAFRALKNNIGYIYLRNVLYHDFIVNNRETFVIESVDLM